jgi:hypothetical protein
MIANGMLDEIAVLVTDMAGVGNAIAHDLRTPLTRVRIGLERGRTNSKTLEELQSVTERAIDALDQSLSVITALLRIGEIENSRGKANFGDVALAPLVREVGDFYSPMAEDKQLTLRVTSEGNLTAYCDRDLLRGSGEFGRECSQIHTGGGTRRSFLAPWRERNHHSGLRHGIGDRKGRERRSLEAVLQIRQKPKYARSGLGPQPRLGNHQVARLPTNAEYRPRLRR